MLNNILSAVNDWMYTYLLLFLLVGTGIYFTIRTRFVQLRLLKESFHVLKEKAGEENGKKNWRIFTDRIKPPRRNRVFLLFF